MKCPNCGGTLGEREARLFCPYCDTFFDIYESDDVKKARIEAENHKTDLAFEKWTEEQKAIKDKVEFKQLCIILAGLFVFTIISCLLVGVFVGFD